MRQVNSSHVTGVILAQYHLKCMKMRKEVIIEKRREIRRGKKPRDGL